MTAAVSSTLPPPYVPPQPAIDANASQTATSPQPATAPAPALTGGGGISDGTLGALVAQQDISTAQPAPTEPEHWSSYEFYMPTRDGFTSRALALAIDDPSAVSSSAGKTDAEIATDARARLDANYARMAASGTPFAANSYEGVDWNSLMGELDPKSLTAVEQNSGGLFTEQEQTFSKMFLDTQAAMRSGAFCGPTRLEGTFYASGRSGLSSADATAAMQSWDSDAAKDQTNVGLQLGRAEMRVMLGSAANTVFGDGMAPKDRMMSLLVQALQKAQATDPDIFKKIGNVRTAEDLKQQDWFKDFNQQFDEIRQVLADSSANEPATQPAAAVTAA